MNHHHYQQRLNHQQIQQQQQLPPPQIHVNQANHANRGNGGISNQHQIPPPIIQKQHLHQNIATLNQKPPQHVSNQTSQNSQIQPSVAVAQRMSYESKVFKKKFDKNSRY
jgi:hypothetical protein